MLNILYLETYFGDDNCLSGLQLLTDWIYQSVDSSSCLALLYLPSGMHGSFAQCLVDPVDCRYCVERIFSLLISCLTTNLLRFGRRSARSYHFGGFSLRLAHRFRLCYRLIMPLLVEVAPRLFCLLSRASVRKCAVRCVLLIGLTGRGTLA